VHAPAEARLLFERTTTPSAKRVHITYRMVIRLSEAKSFPFNGLRVERMPQDFQFGPSAACCSRVVQVRFLRRMEVFARRTLIGRPSFTEVAAARNRLLQLLALSGRGQRHFTTSTLAFVAARYQEEDSLRIVSIALCQ